MTREDILCPRAQLAIDTIHRVPTAGIPTWGMFLMEHGHIERLAGVGQGEYRKRPEEVYLRMQNACGVCLLDQFIPENPLTMGCEGYENREHGATTGAEEAVVDGMTISSPENVVEHLQRMVFPRIRQALETFDEQASITRTLNREADVQARLGADILKFPYGSFSFPGFSYGTYGYANYFMAYALYPEVMERHFSLQADMALAINRASVKAFERGHLPPLVRLDHDMADSRGTLVDVKSLDRIWFPHFARCLEPVLRAGINLIWHCDGNLMEMVPRLLEVGLTGFQGFQYECGMDYLRICQMRDREGRGLIIFAGVSVTRTLPHGTPDDVRREMKWLVDNGPRTGLVLGVSSSVTPGVPWENVEALVEGLNYYRTTARNLARITRE